MDRGTLIFAIGFTIIVGMYVLSMTRIDGATGQNSDNYAARTEARQIARTGIQLAINKLRYNDTTRSIKLPLLGGELTLTVDDSGMGASEKRVVSNGEYSGQSHKVIGVVKVPDITGSFNLSLLTTQAFMEIKGDGFDIDDIKLFLNGHDWTPDTSYHPPDTMYAIGTESPALRNVIIDELIKENAKDSVVGRGTNPSVRYLPSVVLRDSQEAEVKRFATITYSGITLGRSRTWGTLAAPEIVYCKDELTIDYPLTGAGILFIHGDVVVDAVFNWQGYVIFRRDDITVHPSGRVSIQGAIFYGRSGDNLDFNSEGRLNAVYSSYILAGVRKNLPPRGVVQRRPKLDRLFE